MGKKLIQFAKDHKPKSKSLTLDSCGLSLVSIGIAAAISIPIGIIAFGISFVVIGAIIND